MTTHEEVKEWIDQIRQEVNTLKLLLSDEKDAIETAQLIVEDSAEIKGGSLHAAGKMLVDDTVSIADISPLITIFCQQMKTNDSFHSFRNQVRGAAGERGAQGPTGNRGVQGGQGDRGTQGQQGKKGPRGNSGRNNYRPHSYGRNDRCVHCNERDPSIIYCSNCGMKKHPGLCR